MREDQQRLELTLTGALAGVAGWGGHRLIETEVLTGRLAMAAVLLVGGLFWSVMAATGPLPLKKALLLAVSLVLPVTALAVWASFRFDDPGDFMNTEHPLMALFVLATIPLPFGIAELTGRGWRDYPTLFDEAWALFARVFAAALFVGFFWLLLLLSSQLLEIVHLGFFDDIVDSPFLVLSLSGGIGGLGLAVAGELSFAVLPKLGVRLVRLMLPLLVVIVGIFLVALAGQGLGGVFRGYSATAVLLGVTIVAATFVTSALDRADAEATGSRILKISAQAMSVMMPGLAGLAVYALWLRVSQHGWTPDRLAAATLAVVAVAYGLAYVVAVVMGRGWMERIRQVNLLVALGMIATAALWLTPVINPQRISVNSQIARFEAGRITADDLDIWSLTRGWGRAGHDVRERVLAAANADDATGLEARFDEAAAVGSRYEMFDREEKLRGASTLPALQARLKVEPTGREISMAELKVLDDFLMDDLILGCSETTPAGNPGCIALEADFWPDRSGDELALLFMQQGGSYVQAYVTARDGNDMRWASVIGGSNAAEIIDRIADCDYSIAPARRNVLNVGNFLIEPQ